MKNMINQLFFSNDYDDKLLSHIELEQSKHGHYALPNQDISYLEDYVKQVESRQKDIKSVVVVGIGGSSLGAQAIYEFLKIVREFKRCLYFLDSTNPVDISTIYGQIDMTSTHFIIASKSGDTVEVIALYKYLKAKIRQQKVTHNPFSFMTQSNSKLALHAQVIGAICLPIDASISGRFSVFSSVGLAPLALLGVNIKLLLSGANSIKESFFSRGYMQDILLRKASYYAKHSPYVNINALFSYSQSLHFFNHWFVQLWGESLGKQQQHSNVNVGLTPIGLIGPKDQHSFLQLLTQGKRDKSITFIKLKEKKLLKIPKETLIHLEHMDTLNGLSFSELINMQADATIETLKSYDDIPIDIIELQTQNEQSMGQLMYYFELLTSLVGCLMDVNTYNQPGVELTKLILKNKLKKND